MWVILGISYWAVIISFVTKAFQSKKLRRRWEKTAQSIAHQVDELKRNVEKMSPGSGDEFLAHKSKVKF